MRTARTLAVILALCSLPTLADESGHIDHEHALVKQGVLGTANVLRELDLRAFSNLVTVTSNVDGIDSTKPEYTIDGGGLHFRPKAGPSTPVILTYTLPGLRTVSSLVVAYEYPPNDVPEMVRLEGSSDGGKTWSELCKVRPRAIDVLKCFRPAKVNALRLIQEGGKGSRRTKEVFLYADPDVPLPLFGGKDIGCFSFLRDLWHADKIKVIRSPRTDVWTSPTTGLPKVLFESTIATAHDGAWGDASEKGKRLYLRWDLDKAYPMDYGVVGIALTEPATRCILGLHPAEFYTANGNLDPSGLKGSSIKNLTGQGWILQKAWDKDPSFSKGFPLERPGTYNQMLLVWDSYAAYENDRWSHLEMFGAQKPDAGDEHRNLRK